MAANLLQAMTSAGGKGGEGNLALPQLAASATISGASHHTLSAYFGGMGTPPDVVDEKVERLITDLLPEAYRKGCAQMVSGWGKSMKGTSARAIRVLAIQTPAESLRQVLLAFTCFSQVLGDKYYDERLVLLVISKNSSTLLVIPHEKPCGACSELSHIGKPDTVRINRQPAFSLSVQKLNNNPCCQTADTTEDVTVHYFVVEPGGLRQVLALCVKRTEAHHSKNTSRDSTASYAAELSEEKDKSGSITKIVYLYEHTSNGKQLGRMMTAYRWNYKMKAFLEGSP